MHIFPKIFIILGLLWNLSESLRVSGTFNTRDFFQFIAKFGFQKTEIRTKENGYIYGNVSSSGGNSSVRVSLAVLDRGYFLEYYGNRSVFDKGKACEMMFKKIQRIAYDSFCFDDGVQDFLRSVPCANDKLCDEEDSPDNVIKQSQLTYRIQDYAQSR